jgi:hypothetical protein
VLGVIKGERYIVYRSHMSPQTGTIPENLIFRHHNLELT